MKKLLFIFLALITFYGIAQDIVSLKDIKPDKEYDNILVQPYFSDGNQSAFIIWIKSEVKLHKHNEHTENLYIIEGKGEMTIGDKIYNIKKGDFFTIPKGVPHALIVRSSRPVKVLSIQSPEFFGKDRIFIDSE